MDTKYQHCEFDPLLGYGTPYISGIKDDCMTVLSNTGSNNKERIDLFFSTEYTYSPLALYCLRKASVYKDVNEPFRGSELNKELKNRGAKTYHNVYNCIQIQQSNNIDVCEVAEKYNYIYSDGWLIPDNPRWKTEEVYTTRDGVLYTIIAKSEMMTVINEGVVPQRNGDKYQTQLYLQRTAAEANTVDGQIVMKVDVTRYDKNIFDFLDDGRGGVETREYLPPQTIISL